MTCDRENFFLNNIKMSAHTIMLEEFGTCFCCARSQYNNTNIITFAARYEFEYRGLVPVKGIDGLLETYFLERGKCAKPATPGDQRLHQRHRSSAMASLVHQLVKSQKKFIVNTR